MLVYGVSGFAELFARNIDPHQMEERLGIFIGMPT